MKKYVRLEQKDIEFSIQNELARIGYDMVNSRGSWKLIRATEEGERDSIAFECEIEIIKEKGDGE